MPLHATIPRRGFLRTSLAATILTANDDPGKAAAAASDDRLEEARALHRKIPVFLGCCNFSAEHLRPSGGKQCDLAKLDAAGVRTMVGFGCYFQTGPRHYVLAGNMSWPSRTIRMNTVRRD